MTAESPNPVERAKQLIARHLQAVADAREVAKKIAESTPQNPEGKAT